MKITVNPQAQASGDFGYAAPGDYTLRVVACEEKKKAGSEYSYLEWKLEFADPNTPSVEKNADGTSKKVSNIFENTSLKPEAQFRLRDICEALGLTWGDFDTTQVIGMQARARVKLESYDGKIKNVVDRFIKQ